MKFLSISLLSLALLLGACSKEEPKLVEVEDAPQAVEKIVQDTPKPMSISHSVRTVMDGAHRSDKNKARDQYRHPAETLEFLGVKPDSTVVELWPGGGWYSEVLAPYLKDKGTFYAASFGDVKEPEYRGRLHKELQEKFAAKPEVYGTPKVTVLNPPLQTLIAPSGSADFVLTFRNVHNWTANEQDKDVFLAAFKALKPNGIFGVVEHRAAETMDAVEQAKTGYVSEAHVIELAESVGFRLIARSEINANPKDTKDYEKGVWTLPPSLRLKEVDQEKYLAIGESDRMTLKLVKPAAM